MKNKLQSFIKRLKSKMKPILLSILSSLIVLIISYIASNLNYASSSSLTPQVWVEKFFGDKDKKMPDDIILLNVGYDRTVKKYYLPVPGKIDSTYYVQGNPVTIEKDTVTYVYQGKIDVTDYEKLYKFLSVAHEADNYKYILCDLRFEDGVQEDSITNKLFELIAEMPRFCAAKHNSKIQAKNFPPNKSAYSDAIVSFVESNVTRIPIYQDGSSSLPLKMAEEITGKTMTHFGPLYFWDGHLCSRIIFPSFNVYYNDALDYLRVNKDFPFKNISQYGAIMVGDSVKYIDTDYITDDIDGKIIIIGDYVNDTHDSYVENIPGPLILYNTYMGVIKEHHLVRWFPTLLLFLLYTCISYCIITRVSIFDIKFLSSFSQSTVGYFLTSFVSLSLVFILVSLICYKISHIVFDFFIPSIYFSIFTLWYKYKKN